MNDEIALFGSMDQSIPTDSRYEWVKQQVTEQINKAISDHNLVEATKLVQNLIQITKVAGKELTKVLFSLKTHWSSFETDEEFEEWANRELGLHPHTIERYCRVEQMLNDGSIPSLIRKELSDRNLTELFPIANMVTQGYQLEKEQWDEVLVQPDATSIRAKVREIKGQEPRSNALVLRMDDVGTIWAYKDGARIFIGSLEIKDENPVVQSSIDRILKNSGILK